MKSTIKETITSLNSAEFAHTITQKSVRHSVFYWLKYTLIVSLLPLVISLFALAYFVPQLPKLVQDSFPDGQIKIQDGNLSTEPEIISKDYGNIKFLASSLFSRSDLDQITAGILITKDTIFFKNQVGEINSFTIPKIQYLDLSKDSVSKWIQANSLLVFAIGALLFAVVASFTGLLVGGIRMATLLAWSAIASFVVQKIFKHTLDFHTCLKFSLYAAVPAMLVSVLLQFTSPSIASISQIAETTLFLLLFFVWSKTYLSNSQKNNPEIPQKNSQTPITSTSSKRTKTKK